MFLQMCNIPLSFLGKLNFLKRPLSTIRILSVMVGPEADVLGILCCCGAINLGEYMIPEGGGVLKMSSSLSLSLVVRKHQTPNNERDMKREERGTRVKRKKKRNRESRE